MKFEKYIYEVKAIVELSSLELEILRECSEVHYDVGCRRFFSPGNEGYYWPEPTDDGKLLVDVDRRSLDRCVKILSVSPPRLEKEASELASKIRDVRERVDGERERLRREHEESLEPAS